MRTRQLRLSALMLAVTMLGGLSMAEAAGWKTEANRRIEKIRKGDFKLTCIGPDGEPIAGERVRLRQTASRFLFGTCITGNPDSNKPHEKKYFGFVRKHFNSVVLENHMKWYATEKKQDQHTYERADALTEWALENGLEVRGHCLFWSKKKFVQDWVQKLGEDQLRKEVFERLDRIVPRYRGKVICWDVNNEMLDGDFYKRKLGASVRVKMFTRAHKLDPNAGLFTNEYGVLCNDKKMRRYINLVRRLQRDGAPVSGIGIQEHASERFVTTTEEDEDDRAERKGGGVLVPREVWRRLDEFGKLGLPIHLTEISSRTNDAQQRADTLEALFRVGYAHKDVDAILLWGFWAKRHWLGANAALVDKDFSLLPAGKRIVNLLTREWRTNATRKTSEKGCVGFRGFYGTYELSAPGPDGKRLRATVELAPKRRSVTLRFTEK
jgi:GH35 family endo-1,4-beta-xylanase